MKRAWRSISHGCHWLVSTCLPAIGMTPSSRTGLRERMYTCMHDYNKAVVLLLLVLSFAFCVFPGYQELISGTDLFLKKKKKAKNSEEEEEEEKNPLVLLG